MFIGGRIAVQFVHDNAVDGTTRHGALLHWHSGELWCNHSLGQSINHVLFVDLLFLDGGHGSTRTARPRIDDHLQ